MGSKRGEMRRQLNNPRREEGKRGKEFTARRNI